jgi:hypothetical protein
MRSIFVEEECFEHVMVKRHGPSMVKPFAAIKFFLPLVHVHGKHAHGNGLYGEDVHCKEFAGRRTVPTDEEAIKEAPSSPPLLVKGTSVSGYMLEKPSDLIFDIGSSRGKNNHRKKIAMKSSTCSSFRHSTKRIGIKRQSHPVG